MPETADMVTFTEEIFNRKLHFLCSVSFKTLIASFNRKTFFETQIKGSPPYFASNVKKM